MSLPPNPRGPKFPAPPTEPRLEGWGEIATYLRREIRTVQRWEDTLGLPIHRLQVGKQASVWALRSELDVWYLSRDRGKELDEPAVDDPSARAQSPVILAPPPTSVAPTPITPIPVTPTSIHTV